MRMSIEIAPSHTFLLDKVQLRFLGPDDVEVFKILCRDWFPIECVIFTTTKLFDTFPSIIDL